MSLQKINSTFIIAEAGVNHNGSLERAKGLVDAACVAGADAVKFQTFRADKLVSTQTEMAEYQKRNTGNNTSQHALLKALELSESDHEILFEYCRSKKIKMLSTPFDHDSLDMLINTFNLEIIKISSGDLTNAPLLYAAAKTQRPIILSTGMATLAEIEVALGVLAFGYSCKDNENPSLASFELAYSDAEKRAVLTEKVTLLHCTTEYPTQPEEVNLRVMKTVSDAFQLSVGYSDHTAGINAAIAATALGATVIEKHFTLDKKLPGPDHKASLDPTELSAMVAAVREIEIALGSQIKCPMPSEMKNKLVARKHIVAGAAIQAGDEFSEENLAIKRTPNGINPNQYWALVGMRATRDFVKDEAIDAGGIS